MEVCQRCTRRFRGAQLPKKFSEETYGDIVVARVPLADDLATAMMAHRKPSRWEESLSTAPLTVVAVVINLMVAAVAVASIEEDDWSVTAGGAMYVVSTAICVAMIVSGYLARPPRSLGVVWTFLVFAGFMFVSSASCDDWDDLAPCSAAASLIGGVSLEAALLLWAAALYARRHSVRAFNRQFGPASLPSSSLTRSSAAVVW